MVQAYELIPVFFRKLHSRFFSQFTIQIDIVSKTLKSLFSNMREHICIHLYLLPSSITIFSCNDINIFFPYVSILQFDCWEFQQTSIVSQCYHQHQQIFTCQFIINLEFLIKLQMIQEPTFILNSFVFDLCLSYIIHIYNIGMSYELRNKGDRLTDNDDGNESDNNSEQSQDYYQYERKKMQLALSLLKTKNLQNNSILQQLKRNMNSQNEYMDQFQDQVADLHKITRNNENNVLQESVIKQIKEKVFNQSMMNVIQLSDLQLEKKKTKEQAIQNEKNIKNKGHTINNKISQQNQTDNKLLRKIQNAKIERQILQMGKQDQVSMKYEQQWISKFFQQRFYTPQLKIPKNKQPKITNLNKYAPKGTITTLKPLPNTQNNILPRNAPELALRRLGKSKKISFIPSSMSQVPVKVKRINPEEQQAGKTQQKEVQRDQLQIDKSIQEYLNFIKPMLQNIEQAGKSYKPKFINQFLSQNQQSFNIDSQKSQSKLIQDCLQTQKPENIKDIKLTFQHINSLKGIQKFFNVEQVALQFNAILNLSSIENCKKLIQLNLSHNKIKNINGSLKDLRWLKILNVQHNQIDSIQLRGGSLQILNASNNRIQQIIDLSNNTYMKRLNVSSNNLHALTGLKRLHFLQQIDAHNNYIDNLKGIQQCILLRKLNISNNRIRELHDNFTFIFLNKILASGNSISQLPNMFLPSLQQLYLDHNKIQVQSQSLLYFPNLKLLNLDDNKLSGFCVVWSFIRYSPNLETLKYDKNQYFMNIRQKVKELYQHIIYRNMNKLQILNQGAYDIGIKKYYQGAYNNYLVNKSIFKPQSFALRQIQRKITFAIEQNQCMSKLQDCKVKFSETQIFVRHKSVTKAQDLMQIIKFFSNIKKRNEQVQILHATKSLFYEHDKFQYGMRNSIHKIKSLIIGKQYRIKKRRQYFTKNKKNILQLMRYMEQYVIKRKLARVVKIFYSPLQRMGQQKAAIIIQKNWRCYRMRKKYLKVMAKLRKKNYLDDDMQDIDLDDYDFDKMQIPQFNFQLPEQMDFDQYIIRPQIFEMLNKQQQKRQQKDVQNKSKVEKKKQQSNKGNKIPNQMMNNFMSENQSQVSEKNMNTEERKQQQIQKLMKQWGINRQAALALATKNKMKQNQKKKLAEANMTATERYEKFKKQHR